MTILLILTACSQQDGGITGSEPKEILDGVQAQLDQAGAEAEKRLEDAMKKIDGDE
jgi:hypothetical protein